MEMLGYIGSFIAGAIIGIITIGLLMDNDDSIRR